MGPREHRLHWEEGLIMRRLLLVAGLAALLLQEVGSASLAQGLVRTNGKVGAPEQDPEEARGAHMLEALKHDNQPTGLLVAPKLAAATWATWQGQGSEAQAGAEGTWGHAPSWDPEPDRDSLYHPPPEEAQGPARLWPWVLPPQQVLQGPEEDRDHIYHPREAS